ncbi:glutaredoxin family protein [Nocardioides sambongensis]|uniref:glutaredoxin family protein n=1 Tax=Nocardioides sambongensis TaxID=2589074 RepID=UPI00112B93DA|nr:glutaredoxin family protein [Nocardioides sambongensis]
MSGAPRVTVYSRPGCHLCEDAIQVVATVCAELGESYREVSIEGDPALEERYGHEIPVTLVDGAQHDFWRVDPGRLRRALRPPTPPQGGRSRGWRRARRTES